MGVKLNQNQVMNKLRNLARKYWNLEFNLPVTISGQLKSTLGYVSFRRSDCHPLKMKLAKKLFNGDYEETTIDKILLHELCHWAMALQKKPSDDGHPVFEAELVRVGAPATKTLKPVGERHIFTCQCCGEVVCDTTPIRAKNFIKKLNNPRLVYKTDCCKSGIIYSGAKYQKDENMAC